MATAGVHHFGLSVSQLDATAAFFTDCLGWKLAREVPQYPAKFVTDGRAVVTLWQTEAGAAPFDRRKHVGLHHMAIQVDSAAELASLFEQVQAWPGVSVEFAPQPLGAGLARHCMFFEPSGLRMELIWTP
ncbi:MAG: VOC family protein [Ottowia sp.]|nr:VOC family protein [Ottowia sp.]